MRECLNNFDIFIISVDQVASLESDNLSMQLFQNCIPSFENSMSYYIY